MKKIVLVLVCLLLIVIISSIGCVMLNEVKRTTIISSDYSTWGWYITDIDGVTYEVDCNILNMLKRDEIVGAEVYLKLLNGGVKRIRIID